MINNFKDNDMDFIPKENVDYYTSMCGNKYYYQSYVDKLNKVRKKIDKECDRVIKATINKNKEIDELEQITDKQQKEIERLHSITKAVKEKIEYYKTLQYGKYDSDEIISSFEGILDKVEEKK